MRPTLLVLIVFITACAPMAEIDLEVIDPADYTFPVHVQRLAFINCIEGLPVMDTDTSECTNEEQELLNSLAGKKAFEGVREALVKSPMYQIDTIKLLNYERFRNDSIPVPLSTREISYLNGIHPADALISLEKFTIRDSSATNDVKSPDSRVVYYRLVTNAIWRIYDVSNGSILDESAHTDTVIDWHYKSLPSMDEDDIRFSFMAKVIRKRAYGMGIIYGNRISPAWIQVPRYYYKSGGKEMRSAARKAAKDDWGGAAGIWKKVAYEEKVKTAAQASFNMALVCEMEDLMIPAMDWANKSMNLQPDTLTRDYIKILKQRSEQFDELEKQVPDTE